MKKVLFAFLILMVMTGCKQPNKQGVKAEENPQDTASVRLKYAEGFIVDNLTVGSIGGNQ